MHNSTDRLRDASRQPERQRPLIAHVVHYFAMGGIENGLINLINSMPAERYRHAVICLTGYSDFSQGIVHNDVEIVALHKRAGNDLGLYLRLYRTFLRLQPDIVHTRNLATIEAQVPAFFAGVPVRIHAEHGRDVSDLHGRNRKYILLRKAVRPVIDHFVAVSQDLQAWLSDTISVAPQRISQIYDGVDRYRFSPPSAERANEAIDGCPGGFFTANAFVIGSVGRMASVKDYPTLIEAFLLLLDRVTYARERLRLLIVGDGEARERCMARLRQAGADTLAWLPGARSDTPALLRKMDVFVLPSLVEGISNAIQEAMASALPVVATAVGGNGELVRHGVSGTLVPVGKPERLADALYGYYCQPEMRHAHGQAGRQLIDRHYSMQSMTQQYVDVYDKLLGMHQRPSQAIQREPS